MNPIVDTVVGANAPRARTHNRQVVLNRIRHGEEVGRAEIARSTGLTIQAVSNIIADLMHDALIEERGRRVAGPGQPAVLYGLRADGGYALGLEIRTDAVFGATLDLCGRTIGSRRAPLTNTTREAVTDAVIAMVDTVLAETKVPRKRLMGAGIVMPGPFGRTGLGGAASDLAIWDDIDPALWFSQRLDLPVLIENDANAAAIAERVSGVARGLNTYAYLYFGSGLGLGVVQNGRLIRGAFGNAGEIGHIEVPGPDGPVPLERAVSRLSAVEALREAGLRADTSAALSDLLDDGTPALEAWIGTAIHPLSTAVGIVENLFDPEAVILGGAMPDNLLERLVRDVVLPTASVAARPQRRTPRLLRGASGRMTATLGAAALVIHHSSTPAIADAQEGPR